MCLVASPRFVKALTEHVDLARSRRIWRHELPLLLSRSARFHARRTLGRYHDHRHLDCAVAAGRAGRARGGADGAVPEQPQAACPRLSEPRKHLPSAPNQRLGLWVVRRCRPGNGPASAGRMDFQRPPLCRDASIARDGRRPAARAEIRRTFAAERHSDRTDHLSHPPARDCLSVLVRVSGLQHRQFGASGHFGRPKRLRNQRG